MPGDGSRNSGGYGYYTPLDDGTCGESNCTLGGKGEDAEGHETGSEQACNPRETHTGLIHAGDVVP